MVQTDSITTLTTLVMCPVETRTTGLQMALNGFLCSDVPLRNYPTTTNGALWRIKQGRETVSRWLLTAEVRPEMFVIAAEKRVQ